VARDEARRHRKARTAAITDATLLGRSPKLAQIKSILLQQPRVRAFDHTALLSLIPKPSPMASTAAGLRRSNDDESKAFD